MARARKRTLLAVAAIGGASACDLREPPVEEAKAAEVELLASDNLPKPVRIEFHPYRTEERGKFVELCLDRALGRHERYRFSMAILAANGHRQACTGILASDIGQQPSPCQKLNLYVYCLNRHSPAQEREAISEAINPGTVQEVRLRMWKTHEKETGEPFVFKNL